MAQNGGAGSGSSVPRVVVVGSPHDNLVVGAGHNVSRLHYLPHSTRAGLYPEESVEVDEASSAPEGAAVSHMTHEQLKQEVLRLRAQV